MRPLFGAFHITALLLCIIIPLIGAWFARKKKEQTITRLLFLAGCLLALLEGWKQYYVYARLHDHQFDPWFFPFQLCSVPMVLCLMLPLFRGNVKKTVLTFLWDYTFFGALLALLYPEDILNRPLPMLIHGFVWHALLLFISFLVFFSGQAKRRMRFFFSATFLLLILCGIATLLNVFLEGKGSAGTYPDMFYLSPYHLTMQPVAHAVELSAGRLTARLLYILGMIILGALDHLLLYRKGKKEHFTRKR